MNLPLQQTLLLFFCLIPLGALGQRAEGDWYQVEVSIFSNESAADRREELFSPLGFDPIYPAPLRRLERMLDWLLLPEMRLPLPEDEAAEDLLNAEDTNKTDETRDRDDSRNARDSRNNRNNRETADPEAIERLRGHPGESYAERMAAAAAEFGPRLPPPASTVFRFPDPARRPYLQLPPAVSGFEETNRALQRDSDHRLLFHGLWRQPMFDIDEAPAVFVSGGLVYNADSGLHSELEGSLRLGFNAARDRILLAADVWLAEFASADEDDPDTGWYLPPRPAGMEDDRVDTGRGWLRRRGPDALYRPQVVYQLRQEREMRSGEFHYLDHPALGLVISVMPYELPPPPPEEALDEMTDESTEEPSQP